MTFNPAASLFVNELCKIIPEPKTVIEFGNQRYTAQSKFPANSTRDFYERRGFVYFAIDVNTERDSIIADLNEPVNLQQAFYLVTNIGTSEHIFNQYMVFKNAHDLCASGGFMYHQLPFTPWINHGFFNYNPIVFRDIAAANGYDIQAFELTDREGNGFTVPMAELFIEKNPAALEQSVRQAGRNLFCNVVFKKNNDDEFKMPFQGKYKGDIKDKGLQQKYG